MPSKPIPKKSQQQIQREKIADFFNFQEDQFVQKRPHHNASFQSLVEVAANRFGMGREFRAIKICHEARKIISQVLPEYSSYISVISYKEGNLALAAINPALKQRLHTKRHILLEQLNKALGSNIIEKITIRA